MNRPLRRWHLIAFAIFFVLCWAGNDCDGRCPAPQEVATRDTSGSSREIVALTIA